MAIQIGGTTVIDNSRNITNVGIITVGTGGTTGIVNVGTGVTIDGAGNAYFDGFITVNGGINYLVGINSISPQYQDLANAGQFVQWNGDVFLYFDSDVEVSAGSTLTVELKEGSIANAGIRTVGISSIGYPGGDFSVLKVGFGSLTVAPSTGIQTFFPVIPEGIIKYSATGEDYAGNFSGDAKQNCYSFEISGGLGQTYCGGKLICGAGGNIWITAPSSTEVSRTWYSRNDASTRAQQVSGCTGWFVPTNCQLQNPGYCCRTYWDSYGCSSYWSDTEIVTGFPCSFQRWLDQRRGQYTPSTCTHYICPNGDLINSSGNNAATDKTCTCCVRAFRCVSY